MPRWPEGSGRCPLLGALAELRRRVSAVSDQHDTVWLFRGRAYATDPDNRVGAILAETHHRPERIAFPGIELERYVVIGEEDSEEESGEDGGL